MKILSIDTSCDETSVAVTDDLKVLSNTIWSQASLHAKFGGVYPTLAKRKHEEKIDWVIEKALKDAFSGLQTTDFRLQNNIDYIAVTVGPGLAPALEVGIRKAKELAKKHNKKLIAVNHIEGHILSALARSRTKNEKRITKNYSLPALGIVTSGGHTEIVKIKEIGSYEILARTADDALGEALDKAARMLGLGYPGGAVMEKLARNGNKNSYDFPIPLKGQEERLMFSYSGLKTSMVRMLKDFEIEGKKLTKKDIENLSASYQHAAFTHFIRVLEYIFENKTAGDIKDILTGGGVMANAKLRKMLQKLTKEYGLKIHFSYSKKLYGDNAAMIGIAAYFKARRGEFIINTEKLDRIPQMRTDK